MVQGESIAYWYNYKNYLDRSGSLGNSCMSNVDDEYFDIYMSNSDVCKLLILKSQENPNKIVGRALLWTLTGGEKYLDRIYTIKDSDIELFKDYAKEMVGILNYITTLLMIIWLSHQMVKMFH